MPIALIAVRLLPILVVAPVAPFKRAPLMVRVILSIALAIVLNSSIKLETTSSYFGLAILSEFIIGASLAFGLHTANAALHTMGQLIDTQIGFAAAALFDPATHQATSPTAELLTLGLLVTFLQLNVHHDLLLGFAKLLTVIPLGSTPDWSADWLKIIGASYVLAFIIASPIVFSLWLMDLMLSFISRSLPQAPIYFVAMPVKIVTGIFILAWFFTQALEPLLRLLSHSILSWNGMFRV